MESTELTTCYGLGKGTVLGLLKINGVQLRRQGLSPTEIHDAIKLYEQGWSLAKIGATFGHAHTVIRKALLDAGVTLRPRQGWTY